jgi:hypothetical protein
LGNPGAVAEAPLGEGFKPISPQVLQRRAARINNAGFGERVSKGFEGGIEQAKLLGGAALEVFGAEETGREIVENATKELAKLAPYSKEFTEIGGAGDALNWTAYMIGELGPGIIQTAASAVLGGGVGGVAANLALKASIKKQGGALLKQAAKKQRDGKALNDAEKDALSNSARLLAAAKAKAVTTGVRRGAVTGAAGDAFLSGVGEVGAEIIGDRGADGPLTDEDRLRSIFGGAAAGAIDFLPEFGIFKALFRGTRLAPTARSRADSRPFPGASRLRRAGRAAGLGAVVEGAAEAAQEGVIGLAAGTDKSFNDYINALAAGALGGGLISGAAGVLTRGEAVAPTDEPVDLTASARGQAEQAEQAEPDPEPPAQRLLPAPESVITPPVDPEATGGPGPDPLRLTYDPFVGPPESSDPAVRGALLTPEGRAAALNTSAVPVFPTAQGELFPRLFQGESEQTADAEPDTVVDPVDDERQLGLFSRDNINKVTRDRLRAENTARGLESLRESQAAVGEVTTASAQRRARERGARAASGNLFLRTAAEGGLGFPATETETETEAQVAAEQPAQDEPQQRGIEFREGVDADGVAEFTLPYNDKSGQPATVSTTPRQLGEATTTWIRAVRNALEALKTC